MLKHLSTHVNAKLVKQIAKTIPIFVLSFVLGSGLAKAVDVVRPKAVTASADGNWGSVSYTHLDVYKRQHMIS